MPNSFHQNGCESEYILTVEIILPFEGQEISLVLRPIISDTENEIVKLFAGGKRPVTRVKMS